MKDFVSKKVILPSVKVLYNGLKEARSFKEEGLKYFNLTVLLDDAKKVADTLKEVCEEAKLPDYEKLRLLDQRIRKPSKWAEENLSELLNDDSKSINLKSKEPVKVQNLVGDGSEALYPGDTVAVAFTVSYYPMPKQVGFKLIGVALKERGDSFKNREENALDKDDEWNDALGVQLTPKDKTTVEEVDFKK